MKMLAKISFLLSFLSAAIVVKSETETNTISMANTFNCYAEYLKKHGKLEDHFESSPFDGESFLCDMILVSTVNRVYEELYHEFSIDKRYKDSALCIVESLKKEKWSDLDIKEQVIETTDLLTSPEKYEKIRDIKKLQEKISENAIFNCLSDKEFGELFNSIIGNSTQEEEEKSDEDLVGDYCGRKYAIESKLIDTNEYKLNVNPTDIITTYVQCDVINQKNIEESEIELREHLLKDVGIAESKVDCYMEKYHNNHYFDVTLKIAIFGELNLSDEQKKIEKKKFIDTMVKITRVLAEC